MLYYAIHVLMCYMYVYWRFLYRIGMPWAHTRILQSEEYHQYLLLETQKQQALRKQQQQQQQEATVASGRSSSSSSGKKKKPSDFHEFIKKTMAGTIYV